jgi:hypothetical protein
METPQVQQENQTPVVKKRVIKVKKTAKVENTQLTESVQPTETVEAVSAPSNDEKEEKELVSIIPSSRIKNYISKEKLNKDIDTLIESIKGSTDNVDLSKVLNEEYQKKVGAVIKEKEKKGEEIKLNSVVIDVLAKHKFKFSNTSFKVLSVFLDMMVEEITLHAMAELVKNKKSIINLKYIFNNEHTTGPLFNVYSKLSTYQTEKVSQNSEPDESADVVDNAETTDNADTTETTDNVETTEHVESTDSTSKQINFEFYVRKICNKLKSSSEEFNKIKVSEKYQKFCSNLILDFLDRIIPLTKILLEVMTTKTITDLVFETALKTQLFDNENMSQLLDELHNRLKK